MALVRGMVEGARIHGLPVASLLTEAGIAPQLMAQEGGRVTTDHFIALLRLLIERLDDEALGLLSRPLKRGSLALIARSAIGAPDLEAGLRRACHVVYLLQDDMALAIEHEGALAGLTVRLPGIRKYPRFLHEYMIRTIWRLAAWMAGGSLKVQRFDFAFEEPSYVKQYANVFPAPLRFAQGASAFWFDARRLSRPVGRDDAALQEFIASWPASAIIPQPSNEGIVARVHAHLARTRPQWPGLEATAAALHMSAPTLQRHLATAGTSFKALRDELRRDIAIAHLGNRSTTAGDLAIELGFADSATFQRAFKAWTGSPPGAYRTRLAPSRSPGFVAQPLSPPHPT